MNKSKIKGYCLVSFFTVVLYLVLTHIPSIYETIRWIFRLLSPFIIGIIFAFILDGITVFLSTFVFGKLFKKMGEDAIRRISVLFTLLLSIGVVCLLFTFIIPQVVQSVQKLAGDIPGYVASAQSFLSDLSTRADIPEAMHTKLTETLADASNGIIDYISRALPSMLNFAVSMGNSLLNTFISITVAIYFLIGKKKLLSSFYRFRVAFFPKKLFTAFQELSDTALPVFRKYINGQLLDASIIGVVSIIFLTLADFPYAILIGVMMGISNVIPFFGPFIGATPSFLLILMIDPVKAIWYLVFVIILQQLDGNLLAPKIIGDSVGLPPIFVLLSVTLGGSLLGVPGMIFGTPVMATIYAITARLVRNREKSKRPWPIMAEVDEDETFSDKEK